MGFWKAVVSFLLAVLVGYGVVNFRRWIQRVEVKEKDEKEKGGKSGG